jgi:hypothetical protein
VNLHSWRCKRFEGYLPASLNTCGTMPRTAVLASDPVGSKQESPALCSSTAVFQDIRIYWDAGKPYYNLERIKNPTLRVVAEWDQAAPSQGAQALFHKLPSGPNKRFVEVGEATQMQLFQEVQFFLHFSAGESSPSLRGCAEWGGEARCPATIGRA